VIIKFIFFLSAGVIFWAMIGYPLIMELIYLFYRKKQIVLMNDLPSVTLMIVAHNEEKVIVNKLINALSVDYPKEQYEILIVSDFSSDNTDYLCEEFILSHADSRIRLVKTSKRGGKTNAQNEGQKTVSSDILIMTDANSILDKNAVHELVKFFGDRNVGYVCGRLSYYKSNNFTTSNEVLYWERDLRLRLIESTIDTITGGNGAIYACRNSLYHDFPLIESHDSIMPLYMALNGKRALYNPDAIAYEKTGDNPKDEFKRKVRMNRNIIHHILPDIKIINIFKMGWFSFFYFGHRTCRYLLWLAHLLLLITSIANYFNGAIYVMAIFTQIAYLLVIIINLIFSVKVLNVFSYYAMTVLAQWFGVINIIMGKSKPFWEKAESTR